MAPKGKGKAVRRREDEGEKEKLIEELQRFLNRPSTAQHDKETLLQFLSFDPAQEPITDRTPLEEMELRREYFTTILSNLRIASELQTASKLRTAKGDQTRHLTALEVSTMVVLPLESLRKLGETIVETALESQLDGAVNFIQLFVKGRTPKSAGPKQAEGDVMQQVSEALEKLSIAGEGGGKAPRSGTETPQSKTEVSRSKTGRDLAFQRDQGICVVTGTTQPEVCHIIPFAVNSTEKNRGYTRSLLDGGLGCSDKDWNMLCLNQQLHYWWSDARWAFKLLGIIPGDKHSIVRLQFRWLSARASIDPKTPIEMGGSMEKFLESKPTDFTPFAPRTGSSRPVRSGDVFEIKTEPDSAQKMGLMIDIQWAALRISAMSGAAEAPELLDDFEDPDSSYQLQLQRRLRMKQISKELEEDWLERMGSSGPCTPRRRSGLPSSTRTPTEAAGQESPTRAEKQPGPLRVATNLPRPPGLDSPTKSPKSSEKGSPEKSVTIATSTEAATQSAIRERELTARKGRENEPSR